MPSVEVRKTFRRKGISKISWQAYKRFVNRKTRYAEREECWKLLIVEYGISDPVEPHQQGAQHANQQESYSNCSRS
jgi:hypothetical protein